MLRLGCGQPQRLDRPMSAFSLSLSLSLSLSPPEFGFPSRPTLRGESGKAQTGDEHQQRHSLPAADTHLELGLRRE